MPTVTLWGNLGRDGELRTGKNGRQFLKLDVAEHAPKATGNGEGEEEAERPATWWTVLVWQPMASAYAPFMERGLRVCVTGRVEVDTWTDGEGAVRLNRTIIANAVGWEGKRKHDTAPEPDYEPAQAQVYQGGAEDDDPFGDQ